MHGIGSLAVRTDSYHTKTHLRRILDSFNNKNI